MKNENSIKYTDMRKVKSVLFFMLFWVTSFSQWKQFAHDERHTSLSNGSITNLVYGWQYIPNMPANTTSKDGGSGSVITDGYNAYWKWEGEDPNVGGVGDVTYYDKVNLSGIKVWQSIQVGINNSKALWGAIQGDNIITNEDGLRKISASTGLGTGSAYGADRWSPITLTGSQVIAGNFQQVETLNGLFVSLLNIADIQGFITNEIWARGVEFDGRDINLGFIVVDNGKIFHNPSYYYGFTFLPDSSGVKCYDLATGKYLWFKKGNTLGKMSADNGKLFLFENNKLLARSQTNGDSLWAVDVDYFAQCQPPVLANGLAIIATSTGLFAYNQITGNLVWSNPVADILFEYGSPYNDENTCMAAASSSQTLIVTTKQGIYVLDYNTGAQKDFIVPILPTGQRTTNPVIDGKSLFVTVADKYFSQYGILKLLCFRDSSFTTPPPPPPDTTKPVVTITYPTNGQTISGTVTITANATDNDLDRVEYYIGITKISSILNTTDYANGSYTVTVKAFNKSGNVGIASVDIIIYNAPDLIAPVVNITAPPPGQLPKKGSGRVLIKVSATDNVGVTETAIIIKKSTDLVGVVKTICYSGSCSFNWETKWITGTYTIMARCRDKAGNETVKSITVYK